MIPDRVHAVIMRVAMTGMTMTGEMTRTHNDDDE